ncbi:MAG TPA: hypothetical protein VM734_35785 [Kofleriaceae bacterium]|nr:hypothetical protein [Kofleriaceae bacterium]
MKPILLCSVAGVVVAGALGPAAAELGAVPSRPIARLEPGVAAPLPGKGRLPRREGLLVATVGASAFHGDVTGGEAVASLRFAESLGVGAGIRIADDAGVFLRMDALGLAINHWAFLGYADYVVAGGWAFGGAMVAPLHRDTYLRLSIASSTDGEVAAGLGLEHDVW